MTADYAVVSEELKSFLVLKKWTALWENVPLNMGDQQRLRSNLHIHAV